MEYFPLSFLVLERAIVCPRRGLESFSFRDQETAAVCFSSGVGVSRRRVRVYA